MNILQFILDTIVPPDPLIRAIESMNPAKFISQAGTLEDHEQAAGTVSFFRYRNETVKAALIELKTRRNKKITSLLGTVLTERLSSLPAMTDASDDLPLLITIPMTKKRLRERGWNQCELLVEAIGATPLGRQFEVRTDILVKVRENEDQVGKGRLERFENLRGCFEVRDAEAVRGRHAIILDDIITTGATLAEARRALENANARKITLAGVAH